MGVGLADFIRLYVHWKMPATTVLTNNRLLLVTLNFSVSLSIPFQYQLVTWIQKEQVAFCVSGGDTRLTCFSAKKTSKLLIH